MESVAEGSSFVGPPRKRFLNTIQGGGGAPVESALDDVGAVVGVFDSVASRFGNIDFARGGPGTIGIVYREHP